jgi:hypothetical protein
MISVRLSNTKSIGGKIVGYLMLSSGAEMTKVEGFASKV